MADLIEVTREMADVVACRLTPEGEARLTALANGAVDFDPDVDGMLLDLALQERAATWSRLLVIMDWIERGLSRGWLEAPKRKIRRLSRRLDRVEAERFAAGVESRGDGDR